MYEDLIKRLRTHNGWALNKTLDEAADAIKELQDRIAASEATIKRQSNIIQVKDRDLQRAIDAKSQWIPVTERLPEEPYGCLAVVWDNPRYGDGDMSLNYYPEFIGWDGETWNDADGEEIPFDVVYWMRLPQIPEPPKEET